ncbi:tetratricopeptide repeat-containing sensor histidine kinase [Rhodohalobacter sp. 8-1]|uniref:tetratricopeptide repeat-containing sensor histidine kinase n=1 Tax=Rhodohalobacter sp. 8-1 TaxID=3131972 RepID=UPI0030EB43FA
MSQKDVSEEGPGQNSATQDSSELDIIKANIESLMRSNQLSKAYELSHQGLKKAEQSGDTGSIFDISLALAGQFLDRNIPDSTIYYSKKARDLADSNEKLKQALNSLGNGHAKAGRSIIAIDLYENVLSIADSLDNDRYSVGVLINLATAYSSQGDHNKGLQYYFEALERSEELGNNEFIAIITNNLGDKYNELENYDQAEYYLNRSKEVSEAEGLQTNLVRVLLNLGNTYMATERYDDAEDAYSKVLSFHKKSGNVTGEIQVIYNLGMLHLARDNYGKARDYLNESFERSREVNILPGMFYSTNGLGELALETENINEAIERYQMGVSLTEETDNPSMKIASYHNMYTAYKQAGNASEALAWLEKGNELEEDMRSLESDRLRAQYETKFDLRRSEQEKQLVELQREQQQAQLQQQRWIIILALSGITILLIAGLILLRINQKRKNANLKLIDTNRQLKDLNQTVQDQKEELERLNNIKTKLFAIIAHDLRGPLGSLQSLLYLLREHDLSEKETNELTANLEKNMLENSSMMDNLLGWAQSQMNGLSINKRVFDLHLAVQSVLDQFTLQLETKGINLVTEVPENTMIYADYDLMKLVLRNLIANAIKFSNSGSAIYIKSEKSGNGMYKVAIEDHGIGIPEKDRAKIFSDEHFTSTGTNKEKGSGLGLNLCKEYVEKHGGSIWFNTEVNEGTTFYFTIDAAEEQELINA